MHLAHAFKGPQAHACILQTPYGFNSSTSNFPTAPPPPTHTPKQRLSLSSTAQPFVPYTLRVPTIAASPSICESTPSLSSSNLSPAEISPKVVSDTLPAADTATATPCLPTVTPHPPSSTTIAFGTIHLIGALTHTSDEHFPADGKAVSLTSESGDEITPAGPGERLTVGEDRSSRGSMAPASSGPSEGGTVGEVRSSKSSSYCSIPTTPSPGKRLLLLPLNGTVHVSGCNTELLEDQYSR